MISIIEKLRSIVQAHEETAVTHDHLQFYVLLLLFLGIFASLCIKSLDRGELRSTLRDWGVRARRLARTATEIERKTFHLFGLLVPLVYQFLLGRGWSQDQCTQLCWSITAVAWISDLMRLYIPVVRDNWPLAGILREKEQTQLTGSCYFSLGCTLAINMFSPAVACASICFLVVGDMAAALIGVAYGGEACVVKLGREGKKSLEGSVAMFISCVLIGKILFFQLPLAEYAVVVGAAVATVVELWEPFAINDNLTIPVMSGLALHWGFARLNCIIIGEPCTLL